MKLIDAEKHERLLTEDTEDLDNYHDCGLTRYTRLKLLKGEIMPTTARMVQFLGLARPSKRSILELARDSVDNQLRNGKVCQRDTDGDGDCGRPLCPVCGNHRKP